jgi:hypothetical protein
MARYTLLLAVTACLLVRYVGVWDDVRTVMQLVVLMFLATSVTFDEVLARDPMRGVACYLGGLGFAAAVSEGTVVKPLGFIHKCRRSLSQPAKCRGSEYLRIIYGPDYTSDGRDTGSDRCMVFSATRRSRLRS